MKKLPYWILTDEFPSFYDCESKTAVEQTARVYGAMQKLIDEYNKFIDDLNAELENFENGTTEDVELFKMGVNQKFDDFVAIVELKLKGQDSKLDGFIGDIKGNLSQAILTLVREMKESGELSETILDAFEETTNIIETLRTETSSAINTFKAETNEEFATLSTTINASVSALETEMDNFKTETDGKIVEIESFKTEADGKLAELETFKTKFKAETEEKLAELETTSKVKSTLYPSLTDEQKTAIRNLAMSYYNNRTTFYYNDEDVNRNTFADNECYNSSKSKFKMNCSSFVQMLYMGRSVTDFVGKNATSYLGKITKEFDFGYYFGFKRRALSGAARRDSSGNITGYYGYTKPYSDNNLSSFSYNTYYNSTSTRLNNQSFRSYLDAGDIAFELWNMGCEIPKSELQIGDIVFTTRAIINDNAESEFKRHMFRDIVHTLVVTNITADGSINFIDCTDAIDGETKAITYCGMGLSDISDKLRGAFTEENIVMCARHPIAFGYESNVPGSIERI